MTCFLPEDLGLFEAASQETYSLVVCDSAVEGTSTSTAEPRSRYQLPTRIPFYFFLSRINFFLISSFLFCFLSRYDTSLYALSEMKMITMIKSRRGI